MHYQRSSLVYTMTIHSNKARIERTTIAKHVQFLKYFKINLAPYGDLAIYDYIEYHWKYPLNIKRQKGKFRSFRDQIAPGR